MMSFDDNSPPLVQIDLPRLIETRLLVQANSGGGKTWANRRLLEQTHGKVQHLVIDPEGEMHTLREKFDYVLAAPKGGDCPADIKSAAMLARRLLELGVSAIIDIYDLGAQRAQFVKLFLESLMNAPREMWQPVIVLIEECHKFCPERGEGEAVSTEAVKDLMTRGRKRGFCGVLSTQRLSVLHKSAAAECNNRLIGRTALDGDQDRAAKALGFKGRDQISKLAELDDGHFYAFGPALCRTVTEVKIGANQTTHERAGQRRKGPTPPRERVRQYLAQLADLPHEAEAEARNVADLQARVRELEHRIKTEVSRPKLEYDRALKEENEQLRERIKVVIGENSHLRTLAGDSLTEYHRVTTALEQSGAIISKVLERTLANSLTMPPPDAAHLANGTPAKRPERAPARAQTAPQLTGTADLSKLERALLTALAQHWGGLTKAQAILHAGYAANGHVSKAFARFGRDGWTDLANGILTITDAGKAALGAYTPLPRGVELRTQIRAKMRTALERALIDVIWNAYPNEVSKGEAITGAGYSANGHVSKAFARFARLGYIVKTASGRVRGAEEMF